MTGPKPRAIDQIIQDRLPRINEQVQSLELLLLIIKSRSVDAKIARKEFLALHARSKREVKELTAMAQKIRTALGRPLAHRLAPRNKRESGRAKKQKLFFTSCWNHRARCIELLNEDLNRKWPESRIVSTSFFMSERMAPLSPPQQIDFASRFTNLFKDVGRILSTSFGDGQPSLDAYLRSQQPFIVQQVGAILSASSTRRMAFDSLHELQKRLFDNYLKEVFGQMDGNDRRFEQEVGNLSEQIRLVEGACGDMAKIKSRLSRQKETYRILMQESVSVPVTRLNWKLLPRGEWNVSKLISFYKAGNWPGREVDESRLKSICESLKPVHCYIGQSEFQGYVVFTFDRTQKVVLECPFYGNAIYVIDGDWETLCQKPKGELLAKHSKSVSKIVHNETWLRRLKQFL